MPPAGLEPAHTAPEADAYPLSYEGKGRSIVAVASSCPPMTSGAERRTCDGRDVCQVVGVTEIGRTRGPRTCPADHGRPRGRRARSPGSARASPRAPRASSMRARFEPRQRWMPRPNAAWRFSARSMTTSSASLERRRVAVGGRERQQHPVALVHRAAVELEVLGDEAGHGDRRVGAQELLDRGRQERRDPRPAARGPRGAWRGARARRRSRSTSCRSRRSAAARSCRRRASGSELRPSISASSRNVVRSSCGCRGAR